MDLDPRLKEWATPRQAEVFDAVVDRGYRGAARHLGVNLNSVQGCMTSLKQRAARAGFSPGSDNMRNPIPEGFAVKRRSARFDREGNPAGGWVISEPDKEQRLAQIDAAFQAAAETLPRHEVVASPSDVQVALANLYTITDYHLGMAAWAKEGGADWDIEIAESLLFQALSHLVTNAPRSAKAILNIQGDFLHTDGAEPVTPTHRHVLDAAGRYSQMVAAAVRVLRRVVVLLLETHEEVEILFVEGNHDLAGQMWLRHMFSALFEANPRVRVNDSELPYYAVQHGKTMLAFHHGHIAKNASLPLLFAAEFPTIWGATVRRYAHCGHRHHSEVKEHSGMIVTQHQTLAARDAYAARGGWMAERAASCITYHDQYGQVAQTFVTPEMFEVGAPPVLRFRAKAA